jgi:hypothetical protein
MTSGGVRLALWAVTAMIRDGVSYAARGGNCIRHGKMV